MEEVLPLLPTLRLAFRVRISPADSRFAHAR